MKRKRSACPRVLSVVPTVRLNKEGERKRRSRRDTKRKKGCVDSQRGLTTPVGRPSIGPLGCGAQEMRGGRGRQAGRKEVAETERRVS